jgi:hypothetical protein
MSAGNDETVAKEKSSGIPVIVALSGVRRAVPPGERRFMK